MPARETAKRTTTLTDKQAIICTRTRPNQDVFLKLQEQRGKTSHFDDYTSHRFQLRRGIATDFDF